MEPRWPEPVERVAAFLRQGGVEGRIEEFQAGTTTAEDAARAAVRELPSADWANYLHHGSYDFTLKAER